MVKCGLNKQNRRIGIERNYWRTHSVRIYTIWWLVGRHRLASRTQSPHRHLSCPKYSIWSFSIKIKCCLFNFGSGAAKRNPSPMCAELRRHEGDAADEDDAVERKTGWQLFDILWIHWELSGSDGVRDGRYPSDLLDMEARMNKSCHFIVYLQIFVWQSHRMRDIWCAHRTAIQSINP